MRLGKQDFWAMDFSSCHHVYHNYAHFGGGILIGSRLGLKDFYHIELIFFLLNDSKLDDFLGYTFFYCEK